MKYFPFACFAVLSCLALESDVDIVSMPDKKPAIWQVYGVRQAQALDAKHIFLTIGHASCPKALDNIDSYRIVSEDDVNYAYLLFIKPTRAKLVNKWHEKELAVPDGMKEGILVFNRYLVELELPHPMRVGKTYSVVCRGVNGLMVSACRTAASMTYQAPAPENLRKIQNSTDRRALTVMGLRGASPVGDNILCLEFGATYNPAAGNILKNYEITVNGQPVKILAMGRRSKIDAYLPEGWPFPGIMMHEIFLKLDSQLEDGARIRVRVPPQICSGANETVFTFNSLKTHTDSIKVNQIGYLAQVPIKRAYLGRWLGSYPEPQSTGSVPLRDNLAPYALGFDAPPPFFLIDAATGKTAFQGAATLAHSGLKEDSRTKSNLSAENVYYLDFSQFNQPGRYYISVPGVGRSLAFDINDDVYQSAFKLTSQGVFLQRCGIKLGPPYTSWRRIACHSRGLIETTQERINSGEFIDSKNQVMLGNTPKRLVASGGHHDAGDFNPRSHIDVAQNLMDAYEIAPQKFYDGQINIPENHNGLPDILDEAFWALKLWLELQDNDGGVFNGTESDGDPNFIQSAEFDPKGDFAWGKDCKGSFLFAGAVAQAARILRQLGQTAKAEDYLSRAVRAYQWGCSHKPVTPNAKRLEEYTITLRAYAAAQLYHTTRASQYHDDFITFTPWSKNPDAKMIDPQGQNLSLAAYAYSALPDDLADKPLKTSVVHALENEVDMYISGSRLMAYQFICHPWAPMTWGTACYENFLVPVWHAWAVTLHPQKREEYFAWMVRTADNTLGANPLNLSWIVGLGERTVRAPLHNSRYNPSGMCVPGMQVQGPNSRGEAYNFKNTVYPPLNDKFASLHSFIDCHWAIAMDEGTVFHQAQTMAAFGLLLKDHKE